MAPITDSEQIEFLLSCVRHANSGKVDFGEVAKECSIVSRGAAAKRYERLSKGRNNAPGAGSSADSPVPSPKKTPTKSSVAKRKTAPKTAASKKAAAKKGKAMKVFAVALAEVLVKQRTDLAKVEEHSSGEDTEIDEAVLGVSDDALFDQFCIAD
ncbi:hypothetical protein F9C07_1058784 [Aspergillus flavus]|uniref:Myb-like DNA-binding domain-containing protein n=2 Tax=Aspergillus flavus TaxID=5059 RepID=A0A7U2MQB4_ASPFN|nr:hypothetical protein AFLA_003689 [Aspergillus flavus NRRL3357]KAJ1714819.1 hypothetical protein NYO67_3037 [Aspergillus flavus]QRD87921.1 hypothetical protein F9C07_1058784 [Aspergillus flavus]RAQ49488.1 hypothetical protein AFGD_002515 [Aspergillus flavus]RMZ45530.1 hypothetical protein CA14_005314 [Aspergillus flavus]